MYATTVYYYAKVTASDGTVSWLKIATEWNSRYSRYDTFKGDWSQREIKGELDLDEVWTESGGTGTKKTFTEIGSGAFFNFSGLTSVKGTSVKTLKNQAFQECSSLTTINFPNLQTIGENAFAYCSSLVSYQIPASVTSLDGSAFTYCTSLTNLTVDASSTYYSCVNNILYNKSQTAIFAYLPCKTDTSFVVPSSIKIIGEKAFYYNSSLKSIILSSGVETINSYAFYGSSIQSVFLPQSITKINASAFTYCTALSTIKVANPTPISLTTSVFSQTAKLYVPAGSKTAYESASYWNDVAEIIEYTPSPIIQFADATVKSICVANWDYDGDGELSEEEAQNVKEIGTLFSNKTDITSFNELQYFSNLQHITASAFSGCTNLASIAVPLSLINIGYNAFYNTSWLNAQPDGLLYIGNVLYAYKGTMPANSTIEVKDGTTGISDYAFNGCSGLVSIDLPESLKEIGEYTFGSCRGLTSVKIPAGVKEIPRYAFYYSGLQSVELPEGLESIGNSSFRSCSSLQSVVIPNRVTTIGKNTFRDCSQLKSVTMPYYLQTVATDAFRNCSQLQSVYISNLGGWCNVDFADYRANPLTFAHRLYLNESELIDLVIPSGDYNGSGYDYNGQWSGSWYYKMTTVKPLVFYGCYSIKTVFIPSNITSIGSNAFYNCTSLTAVKVEAAPFELTANAFPTKSNVSLYAPSGYADQYKSASVWNTFKAVKAYPDADVNNDNNIDVVDVVDVLRYANGNPSSSFDLLLADMNRDKKIDVNDAKQILNSVGYSTTLTTLSPTSGSPSNTIQIENMELRARKTCASNIVLTNASDNLVGFQMDLTLPEGLSLNSSTCRLSSRIVDQDQTLEISNLGNNTYRFSSVSLSLQPITGNEGEFITLSFDATNLTASGNITISNIRFVTSNSERLVLSNSELEVQPVDFMMFCGGDGTEVNPYQIVDANDFVNLAKDVNGGTTYEGTFFKVVKSEIDFSGVTYTAIGQQKVVSNNTVINPFAGSFDGNNVVIKNLSASNGIFGYLAKKGSITGIVIDESCNINGTTKDVAGIAGASKGAISNCINNASVSGSYHVGGICGDNMGTIINCKNYGAINSSYTYCSMAGGIAGDVDGGKIQNCENYGSVTGVSNAVGGIVGLTVYTCTIENCINKGDVTGTYLVGGIIGDNYQSVIVNNNFVSGCTISATSGASSISYSIGAITPDLNNSAANNFYTSDVIVKAGNTVYDGVTPRGVWGGYDTSTSSYVTKDITENCAAMLLQKGDINKEGNIDAQDASLILQYVAKKIDSIFGGDVNDDGVVDAQDASLILQYVAKKITW